MFFTFMGELLQIVLGKYADGNTAVFAKGIDGEPWATISVNLPESKSLPTGFFYVKDWSENRDIVAALIEAGHLDYANPFLHEPVKTGFVTAHVGYLTAK